MNKIQTEILVIGGGATGTGILRDLAMRGFQTLLVERRDLTHGTTGRFHGLLHSGGRYAVKDPEAARECIEENRILRRIMPKCIEDTGGYFVRTPDDDPEYMDKFLRGCREVGIPTERISIKEMLSREPHLNPNILQCIRVPDGAADGFAAAHANVKSAKEHGAQILTYHEVTQLITKIKTIPKSNNDPNNSRPVDVVGAICHDLIRDQTVEIHADLTINAAGAWVGKIGKTAGVEIAIRPGKGTMIAVSHRIVNTVINRLKLPSDGDILVPAHTVAVMGTTDVQVPDPDKFSIEPWEIQLMLTEGEKIIPGFSNLRMLRAWAGVRPLYQETRTDQSRDITRSYVLLDHEERDLVTGLVTITGGKWTTYRKMAEITVNKVCEKLDTQRVCRTHLEGLPDTESRSKKSNINFKTSKKGHHLLGERLSHIEQDKSYGSLICECELVTRDDIVYAINDGQAKTFDDIRRDIRLGMGPCQGGFCTIRAAGILHQLSSESYQFSIPNLNSSIRDFLQERWKGLLPILWGQQLRQESLNELVWFNVLNIDHLPGQAFSRLATENYLKSDRKQPDSKIQKRTISPSPTYRYPPTSVSMIDTIIIGSGLAGLTAAWRLASRGQKVRVVAKGWGATHWGSGCIDLLGYYPTNNSTPIDTPLSAIARLGMEQPNHPYSQVSIKTISKAMRAFQDLCGEAGYPLYGTLERNWLLPTSAGAVRPTSLAPETFIGGDITEPSPMLLVGIEGYNDFYPDMAAANLKYQGISTQAITIKIPSLQNQKRIDTMILARYFDRPETPIEVAEAIKPHIGKAERIGFPAILGLENSIKILRILESLLGCRVFEIPGLPPSVPGMRLHNILIETIHQLNGQVFPGMEITNFQLSKDKRKIESIFTEAAARPMQHHARNFILATGGILGGGIMTNHNREVFDPIFDLPVWSPKEGDIWLEENILDSSGHSIMSTGVQTDEHFNTSYENLYAVGSILVGEFIRERSLEGTALVSGYQVGETLS